MEKEYPTIVFFDGICNLCNGSVKFLIRRDRKGKFQFASLQGSTATQILDPKTFRSGLADSFVLYENGKFFYASTAVLRTLRILGGGWKILYPLIILPQSFRDGIYRWIANHRYRWFGTSKTCWVMRPEWSHRFLP